MIDINKIKYWECLANNLSIQDAIEILKTGLFKDNKDIAVRNKYRIFTSVETLENEKFSYEEFFSKEWEVITPNNELEDKLENLREYIQENNFLNLSTKEIYNMSINDIYYKIVDDYFWNIPEDNKISVIKNIIRNRLYLKVVNIESDKIK